MTPPTRPRLDPTRLPLATVQQLAALRCAVDVAELLRRFWTASEPSDPFSPSAIEFWHSRDGWAILRGAELGRCQRYDGEHGSSDQMGLAEIKAQIEQALDLIAADRLHWRSVSWLYRRQERFKDYLAKRAAFGRPEGAPHEPDPPWGLLTLYSRMASASGWNAIDDRGSVKDRAA